jgi:hypothetical protein
MNISSPFGLAILPVVIFAFYGGAYLYALIYYKFKKKASWISSLGVSFLWLFLYAICITAVADVFSALKIHPVIFYLVMGFLVVVPYLAAVRLYFKSRQA